EVRFEDAESLRGHAGLRFGGVFETGDGTFAPFVGIRAIEEFDGENRTDFNLGTLIELTDQAPGTYGELSGGLSVITGHVELFARGEMLFGEDVDGQSFRAGLRIRF
ncbi:MAG TPA: autotransporter domain-containing protein, partial [Allosphingosinicella sp.]|nr:autotransporter domain-containing protein [Allosphingosinicella sp.]